MQKVAWSTKPNASSRALAEEYAHMAREGPNRRAAESKVAWQWQESKAREGFGGRSLRGDRSATKRPGGVDRKLSQPLVRAAMRRCHPNGQQPLRCHCYCYTRQPCRGRNAKYNQRPLPCAAPCFLPAPRVIFVVPLQTPAASSMIILATFFVDFDFFRFFRCDCYLDHFFVLVL